MIVAEQFPRPIPTFAVRFGNARFTTRTIYVNRERSEQGERKHARELFRNSWEGYGDNRNEGAR